MVELIKFLESKGKKVLIKDLGDAGFWDGGDGVVTINENLSEESIEALSLILKNGWNL